MTEEVWWAPAATKSDGPSALAQINVRRMILHIQKELEQVLENNAEMQTDPLTKRGLALIKEQAARTKAQYAAIPGTTVYGGVVDRFTLTRVLLGKHWWIRATMMHDDGTESHDADFRSRRRAGAWARRIIRMGFVNIDVDTTIKIEKPLEHISFTTTLEKTDAE
ncbi:hypothetical protein D3C85_1379880 [compost metagenome]